MNDSSSTGEITPSMMSRLEFVEKFGGIFEHSSWIAERAYDVGLSDHADTALGLHTAMTEQFNAADIETKLGVLMAHPDLAGKLAAAKRLTTESTNEQASAGLDALTDNQKAHFTELNEAYTGKFGFPFIIAVKGLDKGQILQAFETRINNDREAEFATACKQVERIALLRLIDILPSETSS